MKRLYLDLDPRPMEVSRTLILKNVATIVTRRLNDTYDRFLTSFTHTATLLISDGNGSLTRKNSTTAQEKFAILKP